MKDGRYHEECQYFNHKYLCLLIESKLYKLG